MSFYYKIFNLLLYTNNQQNQVYEYAWSKKIQWICVLKIIDYFVHNKGLRLLFELCNIPK